MSKRGRKTAKELVREKYPTAFADDDGEKVLIRIKTIVRRRKCGRTRKRTITDFTSGFLGVGGTSSAAWESAAYTLGLLP